jgi:hypothetical protein
MAGNKPSIVRRMGTFEWVLIAGSALLILIAIFYITNLTHG